MTRDEAIRALDGIRAGKPCPRGVIDQCLRVTGDLPTLPHGRRRGEGDDMTIRQDVWDFCSVPRTVAETHAELGGSRNSLQKQMHNMSKRKMLISVSWGQYIRCGARPKKTHSEPRTSARQLIVCPIQSKPEPVVTRQTHLNRGVRVMRDALGVDVGLPVGVTIADPRPAWETQVETHHRKGVKVTIAKTPKDRWAVEARGVIQRGHWPAEVRG